MTRTQKERILKAIYKFILKILKMLIFVTVRVKFDQMVRKYTN